MNGCYVDANILVNYKNEDSSLHQTATEVLTSLVVENQPLLISPLVIDEFLNPMKYILDQRKNVYTHLRRALREILTLPKITVVNPSSELKTQMEVIKIMEKYKLQPRDAYHLLVMRTNEIQYFATLDTDFKLAFEKKAIRQYKI